MMHSVKHYTPCSKTDTYECVDMLQPCPAVLALTYSPVS